MFEGLKEKFGMGGGDEDISHPGAAKVNRTWEMAKHVLKKAAKYALIGAIAGAVLFAIGPAFISGTIGAVASGIAGLFGGGAATATAGFFGSGVAGAALAGVQAIAPVAALVGAISGLTGMHEAADQAEEVAILNHDRAEARMERKEMLAMQRGNMMANMVQRANPGFLPSKGVGVGMGPTA